MRKLTIVLSLALLAILLPACQEPETISTTPISEQTGEETISVEPTESADGEMDAYPVETMVEDAYPAQQEDAAAQESTSSVPPPTPQPVPTPPEGRAVLIGHIISESTNEPITGIPVRLAEIYRNEEGAGAFVLDGAQSPGAITDENGRFIFDDLEAREYVLVVGNVENNQYEIWQEDTGQAIELNIPADEVTDLGDVRTEIERN